MALSRRIFITGSLTSLAILPFLRPEKSSANTMRNSKFIEADGIKTRYFEGGKGENIVLVHGGNFGVNSYSANVWSLNFDDLCEHFHVYAFDKLGQGYTDNPKTDADYTMDAVIRHTYGFIRKLGIEKVSLLGHSRGVLPIARIAVDHPEMVKCLIILDSSTLAPDDPSVPKDFYARLEQGAPPVPTKEYVRREPDANSYLRDHVTDEYVEGILKIALLPKTAEVRKIANRLGAQFNTNLEKVKEETLDLIKAGRLKVPTLIVWGFNDSSAPVKLGMDLFKIISPVVKRAQYHVFNEAGHYVFREHAKELNQIVINFIRRSLSD